MTTRFSILAVCLLALILSTVALGQDPAGQGSKRKSRNQSSKLKKMDVNQDGQITRDEWKGRDRGFQKADRNNDGIINREEALAGKGQANKQHVGRRQLKRMDADKNRQITRGEWSGDPENFTRLDTNNDGVITRQEMRSRRRKG